MPRSRRASRSAAIVSDRADGLRPLGSRVTWRSPSGPEAAMATWLCDEATATGATKSQARGSLFDPCQCPVRPTVKNCVCEIEADKCPLKKTTRPFPRIRNSGATGTNGKRRAASKCRSFRAGFSTPASCFVAWTCSKSIRANSQATILYFSANSRAYAHCAAAKTSARRTSRINSTTPDGIGGGCIARIPQCSR